MPVTEVRTEPRVVYKAADGREFTDRKAAEKHDELIAAKNAFDQAWRIYGTLLAARSLTADGFGFTDRHWTYWHVRVTWNAPPMLQEIHFTMPNFYLCDTNDEVVLTHFAGHNDREAYRISTLYWDKKNAEAALLVESDKWLADKQAEIEELRRSINAD